MGFVGLESRRPQVCIPSGGSSEKFIPYDFQLTVATACLKLKSYHSNMNLYGHIALFSVCQILQKSLL